MNVLRTILVYSATIVAGATLAVLVYPHYKAAPVEVQSALKGFGFVLLLFFSALIVLNGLFRIWIALKVFDVANLPWTLGSFLAGLGLVYLGTGLLLISIRDAGWIDVPNGFLKFPDDWNVVPLAFLVLAFLFVVNVLAILCEIAWFYLSRRFNRTE